MLVKASNREEYLRTKSRIYVAGWVAAEGNETMQKKPAHGAYNWETYYKDYESGYGDCVANGECVTMGGNNVS